MGKKILSIIVPMYNSEEYVNKFVDSLLLQSNQNFEVVFIDDYSSDDTVKILEDRLAKTNIITTIFCQEKNRGVSAARNIGIKLSKGEYITFADMDDVLATNFVNGRVESMWYGDVALHSIERHYKDGRVITEVFGGFEGSCFKEVDSQDIINKIFLSTLPAYSVQFTMKREIAEHFKYDINVSYQEDVLFFVKLLCEIKNVIVSDVRDYQYWQNSDSVTHNLSMKHVNDLTSIMKQLDQYKLPDSYATYKQRLLSTLLYHTAKLTTNLLVYNEYLT